MDIFPFGDPDGRVGSDVSAETRPQQRDRARVPALKRAAGITIDASIART